MQNIDKEKLPKGFAEKFNNAQFQIDQMPEQGEQLLKKLKEAVEGNDPDDLRARYYDDWNDEEMELFYKKLKAYAAKRGMSV